ncbi:N-acetylmuramoyl-L-alanine amidase [Nocardioides dongxiaopingii]|uniref:N-acetylmuramoyl-L-alanine amidase n=1 Tax=Nocardioides dongxiaopingii TaxID=2576036 RepID=UPI001FE92373|nr:N-acetylmuramoyl-L-alanine amidase [Nocardioides dongxiaopingii]
MLLTHPAALALALSLAVAGCGGGPGGSGGNAGDVGPAPASRSSSSSPSAPPTPSPGAGSEARPLKGRVVVVDPGHQLGNRNFPEQVSRPVPAGGFTKPCNTTGTATDAGYPEATFTWQVARLLTRRLERLGARVVATRTTNSERRWGPCVDVRGRAGNRLDADLKLSIHADGSYAAGAHGFHVIRPPDRARWTDDIVRPSRRLALDVRRSLRAAGFAPATYVAGGDGLDVRRDLGTLNLSDVPTVLVELGNMRSPVDARTMTGRAGRARYADALAAAVVRNLR